MNNSHLLTIAVEDYFQYTAMGKFVPESRWNRFESRIEQNTLRVLDLLDTHETKATFFVLGWIADEMPAIVREIARRGHELASKGYYHRPIQQMLHDEFRKDARRSKHAIERATHREVLGYRVAQGHFRIQDLWALEVLSEEGYCYDSSFYPRFRSIAGEPWRRFPHVVHSRSGDIWEMPLSTWGTDKFLIPAAGGNYFRQAPRSIVRKIFRQWATTYKFPFNMYFHIWELDPDLPEISSVSWLSRIRMYRNIGNMVDLYKTFLEEYHFTDIAHHLQMMPCEIENPDNQQSGEKSQPLSTTCSRGKACSCTEKFNNKKNGILSKDRGEAAKESSDISDITIIIPCYNEELIIPYLANTLHEVKSRLSNQWKLHFLFVDDGSTDNTWEAIQKNFGNDPEFAFVRHCTNRGVAAAILTGIKQAKTTIVCSIDCDCTYDPLQLESMLPMLKEDISLVTASPYHPLGKVLNVPGWRLFLSKGLSRIYGLILHHKLATYTSCFRVYRREAVADLDLQHENFLGIAELIVLLDLRGKKIVECPAVLEVRIFGTSKMKTMHTILGHLGLIVHTLRLRSKIDNHKNIQ